MRTRNPFHGFRPFDWGWLASALWILLLAVLVVDQGWGLAALLALEAAVMLAVLFKREVPRG